VGAARDPVSWPHFLLARAERGELAGGCAIELSDIRTALPRSRTVAGGLIKSLLLLGAALAFAAVVAIVGVVVLRLIWPGLPAWWGLLIGLGALVAVLPMIARRYAWIMPWYYVLPSIVFLLTFTFFPVLLTIWLAFTDYAGTRNGLLNVATTTPVVGHDGTRLTVDNPLNLNCTVLRNGCVDVRAEVYSFEALPVTVTAYADGVLTLADPLPRGREPRQVEMFLPDLGFEFSTLVAGVDGLELRLVRAPPFPPDLEAVTVQMADEVRRTIVPTMGRSSPSTRPCRRASSRRRSPASTTTGSSVCGTSRPFSGGRSARCCPSSPGTSPSPS
jgi:hypothetical protein